MKQVPGIPRAKIGLVGHGFPFCFLPFLRGARAQVGPTRFNERSRKYSNEQTREKGVGLTKVLMVPLGVWVFCSSLRVRPSPIGVP